MPVSKIVDRTLDFIELFANQRRPLSLSEIARLLDIPVSSCHDVLRALVSRGYVYEIAARAGFYPTVRLLKLAEEIVENDPLVLRAEAIVEQLRTELDETITLTKAGKNGLTYVLVRESDHRLRYSVREGEEISSLYATSAGKCLLGSMQPAERDAALKKLDLVAFTPKTITNRAALRKDIAEGEARGWFINDEESALSAQTLSARFVWRDTIYILTIAGPVSRIAPKRELAASLLMAACAKLDYTAQLKQH